MERRCGCWQCIAARLCPSPKAHACIGTRKSWACFRTRASRENQATLKPPIPRTETGTITLLLSFVSSLPLPVGRARALAYCAKSWLRRRILEAPPARTCAPLI